MLEIDCIKVVVNVLNVSENLPEAVQQFAAGGLCYVGRVCPVGPLRVRLSRAG